MALYLLFVYAKKNYMNKVKLYLIWCLVMGALVSCDKKDDSAPTPVVEKDYLPTAVGNTWTYGGTMPYTATITGATKNINGKVYLEAETKQGSSVSKSYLLKENKVYTTIGMVQGMGNLALIMLKEDAAVGETWEHTTMTNGIDTKLTFTIAEKNISKTVGGKTFDNVIHVNLKYSYSFDGEDFGLGEDFDFGDDLDLNLTADYYYAKGVGLILSDLGAYGQIPLVSYSLK